MPPVKKSTTRSGGAPPPRVGPAMPDRRLASVFTKRSNLAPAKAVSVGILSTYPPTRCGVAAFTASLRAGLLADQPGLSVGIVRIGPDGPSDHDQNVVHELPSGGTAESHDAARALNKFDVVIIQHDYAIYAGSDGDQVLDILEWIRVPVILVVHTVLADPTAHQRFVLEMLTQSADAVVTMSESGRRRLLDDYRVEPRKLMLIPHGAQAPDPTPGGSSGGRRPMILTWGLLGPGKGIELGISALSSMSLLRPRPRYVVAGQTHPRMPAEEGQHYYESLARHAKSEGVTHLVEFEPGYVSPERLRELLREADVVLLPYTSREQVTSGILIEALAARVPVVATAFPHASELLADGRGGVVVRHDDPAAIAGALTRIIVEPGLAGTMSTHNGALTTLVSWPVVATQYRQLFDALLRRSSAPSR